MADNKTDNIGKYARHPRRVAGGAFLVGTAIGASLAAAKVRHNHNRNPLHKLMDQLG